MKWINTPQRIVNSRCLQTKLLSWICLTLFTKQVASGFSLNKFNNFPNWNLRESKRLINVNSEWSSNVSFTMHKKWSFTLRTSSVNVTLAVWFFVQWRIFWYNWIFILTLKSNNLGFQWVELRSVVNTMTWDISFITWRIFPQIKVDAYLAPYKYLWWNFIWK